MFFQIITQCFSDGLVYGTGHFTVTQFCFCLSFKLRFGHLDRITAVRPSRKSSPWISTFCFFQQLRVFSIFLQCTCQTTTETGEVCTTFNCINIIYIGEHAFVERCVVCHGYFNRNTLLFCNDMDNVRESGILLNGLRNGRILSILLPERNSSDLKEPSSFITRLSVSVRLIPAFRNASSRKRVANISYLYSKTVKILPSGLKRDSCSGRIGCTDNFHVVQRFTAGKIPAYGFYLHGGLLLSDKWKVRSHRKHPRHADLRIPYKYLCQIYHRRVERLILLQG